MNAVILAGGAPDAVSALHPGAVNKAFVPIAGITLVERTLRALRDTPGIDRIVTVAPRTMHGEAALALSDECRDDGPRMIESLRSGLAGFPPDVMVLVAASDLPALTRAAIREVLDAPAMRDVDLAYTCLARAHHDARYPHIRHTWARMRDGAYCGGGLSALKPRLLPQLELFLDTLGAARKSPLRLAAVFGWDLLARFAIGRLSIEEAEARASRILAAPAAAIRCTHPEIAINVDEPGDVAQATAVLMGGTYAA